MVRCRVRALPFCYPHRWYLVPFREVGVGRRASLQCILIFETFSESVISFSIRANSFHWICLYCFSVRNKIYVIGVVNPELLLWYLYFLWFRFETFIIFLLKLQAWKQASTTQQVDLNIHVRTTFHTYLDFFVHKYLKSQINSSWAIRFKINWLHWDSWLYNAWVQKFESGAVGFFVINLRGYIIGSQ